MYILPGLNFISPIKFFKVNCLMMYNCFMAPWVLVLTAKQLKEKTRLDYATIYLALKKIILYKLSYNFFMFLSYILLSL